MGSPFGMATRRLVVVVDASGMAAPVTGSSVRSLPSETQAINASMNNINPPLNTDPTV
jgi:hypothetical protein